MLKLHIKLMTNELLQLLDDFPDELNWDWDSLSRNPNMTFDKIKNNQHKLSPSAKAIWENRNSVSIKCDWYYVSISQYITIDDIVSGYNSNKKWSWYELSVHPNITIDDIKSNLYLPWDWRGVSENPNITLSVVDNNPDIQWDWYNLSMNPSITWDDIINNIDTLPSGMKAKWKWEYVSKNPNITASIVRDNPDKKWCFYMLSENLFSKHPFFNFKNKNIITSV